MMRLRESAFAPQGHGARRSGPPAEAFHSERAVKEFAIDDIRVAAFKHRRMLQLGPGGDWRPRGNRNPAAAPARVAST